MLGVSLVHAINDANGSSLSDRCFRYYRLHYKCTDHSDRRVTFAISESYRAIGRSSPCAEIFQLQSASFPIFAAISSPEYCTGQFMSETQPLEYVVQ